MIYNKKFEALIEKLSHIEDDECQDIKVEMEILAGLYRKKDARLNKIIKLSDKQQMAILELHEELDSYKNDLELKVKEEMQKRLAQEDILLEQSRLASIAEMIDAVAHQWIQPINILSMQIDLLNLETQKNKGTNQKRVEAFREDTFLQIHHLTDSLDNFRQFFKPIQEVQTFFVSSVLQSVLALIKDELEKYEIKIIVNIDEDFEIVGNENEFKHILINFINNSKYEFLQQEKFERRIFINILGKEKKIEVLDNAGGINEDIIENIFDMNITSKGSEGTGIGLYMSQKIAHKHNGELSVMNAENGAKFTFTLKEKLS
jgi:signal transduction histidine kinase